MQYLTITIKLLFKFKYFLVVSHLFKLNYFCLFLFLIYYNHVLSNNLIL